MQALAKINTNQRILVVAVKQTRCGGCERKDLGQLTRYTRGKIFVLFLALLASTPLLFGYGYSKHRACTVALCSINGRIPCCSRRRATSSRYPHPIVPSVGIWQESWVDVACQRKCAPGATRDQAFEIATRKRLGILLGSKERSTPHTTKILVVLAAFIH